jgi:hypothetical protein
MIKTAGSLFFYQVPSTIDSGGGKGDGTIQSAKHCGGCRAGKVKVGDRVKIHAGKNGTKLEAHEVRLGLASGAPHQR